MLKEGVDYKIVDLESNTVYKKVGEYKVVLEGMGKYTGLAAKTFVIVKAPKTVGRAVIKTQAWATKKAIKVTLKKAKNAKDYRVFYRKASAKKWKSARTKGKRSYTIKKLKAGGLYQIKAAAYGKDGKKTIKGKYSKTKYRYLAGAKKLRTKAGKKKMTVSWKKTKGASGYEIYYSLKKNMKKSVKVTVKGGKKTKKVIKKLKTGKRYYVLIRPYKNYKGKKYSGIFSNVKKPSSVKVK